MDKSTLLEILENEFNDENASYMIFKFKGLTLKEEIEIEARLIEKADTHENMLWHYYSASSLIDFVKSHVESISEAYINELHKLIEDAHNEYYEKAKNELKSAHKRLF